MFKHRSLWTTFEVSYVFKASGQVAKIWVRLKVNRQIQLSLNKLLISQLLNLYGKFVSVFDHKDTLILSTSHSKNCLKMIKIIMRVIKIQFYDNNYCRNFLKLTNLAEGAK